MITTELKKQMPKPNKKQQECIDNIKGKYLVLAGPGTGKTFTVAKRIKSMLQQQIDPSKILCLTYSEAAANEMKNKIARELNVVELGINIYTYHAFCNDIIGENFCEFEINENYKLINETISKQFIKECIDEFNPVYYRTKKNDPYYFISEIYKKITQIKKYRYSKDEYMSNIQNHPEWYPVIIEQLEKREECKKNNKKEPKYVQNNIDKTQKKIDKAKELWEIYELYKSKMEAQHYIDFDDMLGFVVDKFKSDSSFLNKIANKYEYILVDEYQDTNKIQNEIVFSLVGAIKSQNIFVVGDDDQIIYTFQGAKLDTMENFLTRFPDTNVICLTDNMRSTQSILDVSYVVANKDNRRLEKNPDFKKYNIDKKLTAKNDKITIKDKKVKCIKFQDSNQECCEIVNNIEQLVNSSDCPMDDNGNKKLSEIAILAQTNTELNNYAEKLKNLNIPFEIKLGKNIFEIKSSIVLYYYMQMLVNPELNCDKIYRLLLMPPFRINNKDFMKLYEKKTIDKSFIESMRNQTDWIEADKINNFLETYDFLNIYKTKENLKDVVLEIGAKTGIVDYFLNEEINRNENISGLQKIINEASNFSTTYKKIMLEDFVEYLDIALNQEMPILTDKSPVEMNAIQLTTYHSSKGREYEYVFMPSLISTNWEAHKSKIKPEIPVDKSEYKTNEQWDEYRLSDTIKLMYVGMTRAKHSLNLSYFEKEGKEQKELSTLIPINNPLIEMIEFPKYDDKSYLAQTSKSLSKRDYDYKKDFKERIDKVLVDKFYSPTSIGTYMKCPKKYFYDEILNLAPISGNADNLHYGRAVHNACQHFVEYALKNNEYPTKEFFINDFTIELTQLNFSDIKQKEIFLGRGKDELDKFYHHLTDFPIKNLYQVETKLKKNIDGINFSARLDRLDKNDDGSYTIYDYKTGNAKNDKIICKDGEHEDYFIQILLYKYFYEKEFNYKIDKVGFIFPIDGSIYEFYPTEDDMKYALDKFKEVIKNINDCNFEPTQDKQKACEYCGYREFCNMDIV